MLNLKSIYGLRLAASSRPTLDDLTENTPEMSQKTKKRPVRIVNAASGPGYTNHRSAHEYVDQGRARWLPGGKLEFIGGDPRHQRVCRTVREFETDYDRAARSGISTLEALRHVPFIGQPELLFIRRSGRAAA